MGWPEEPARRRTARCSLSLSTHSQAGLPRLPTSGESGRRLDSTESPRRKDTVAGLLLRAALRPLVAAPHAVSDKLTVTVARAVRENEITDFEIGQCCLFAVTLVLRVGGDIDDRRIVVAPLHGDRRAADGGDFATGARRR